MNVLCDGCGKLEVKKSWLGYKLFLLGLWWEEKRAKLMESWFAQDLKDLTYEKYTQGFTDGHKIGYMACVNQLKTREEVQQQIIKEGIGSWLKPVKDENYATKDSRPGQGDSGTTIQETQGN